jgi:hypothetical protein
MKKLLLFNLALFFAATPCLLSQTSVSATPPIPEEARRHFVIGTTLFKDAKTPDVYAQVESQFKQAADLAPQWPNARYNLALSKEAAGDYSGAMADLKVYQQFKLSDEDARKVQDKIYVLEAKADEAAKKVAGQQQAAADEEQRKRDDQDKIGFLAGTWNASVTWLCDCPGNGMTQSDTAVVTITGKDISIAFQNHSSELIKGEIFGDDSLSIKWMLTHGDSCPDLPDLHMVIFVTADKIDPHIKWNGPSHNCGDRRIAQAWNWGYHGAYELTK